MNNTNTGGPAFPTGIVTDANGVIVGGSNGMTLRDYFAAKAMQGLLSATLTPNTVWSQDEAAETAYNVADAMLKAREA
jgi:2-keto-3-deoxy-6-phosphogluconate aldolase